MRTTQPTSGDLPLYRDLPFNDALRGRVSWGVFGDQDDLGTIGLIGPDEVLRAASEIRRGARFPLSLPLNEPDPPPARRQPFTHHIFKEDRNSQDDWLDGFYMQSSSQWDGFRHVQAREFGFYNGVTEADAGPEGQRLGIDRWVEHGIVTRCVLADVKQFAESHGLPLSAHESVPISPELLADTLQDAQVEPRRGDILLVRTGYLSAFRSAPREERLAWDHRLGCPGLVGSETMAELLWDWHIAGVCSDTPAVEVRPGDPKDGSLHRRAIAMLGLAFGELFDLEALADDCRRDGRYTAFFAAVPLNLPGGVGSPANAIACK